MAIVIHKHYMLGPPAISSQSSRTATRRQRLHSSNRTTVTQIVCQQHSRQSHANSAAKHSLTTSDDKLARHIRSTASGNVGAVHSSQCSATTTVSDALQQDLSSSSSSSSSVQTPGIGSSANNIVSAGGLLRGFSKHRALVLDSSYRPINTVNWFKAVCMDMAGKVDVIKYYDAYEPSAYRLHQLPAVVVVRHFVDVKESWNLPKWKLSPAHHAAQMSAKVALTRRNIMIRDRFCCQYCGSKRNLTLDHVHPQSKGGRNTWCNLVTACMVCNQKKGSRTLQQLGSKMVLRCEPREPKPYEVGALLGVPHSDVETPPPEWADFIAPFRAQMREAQASFSAASGDGA